MISPTQCGIADGAGEREQVYRLRHDCYLREAFIAAGMQVDARLDQPSSDRFDEMPNHFSFRVRSTGGKAAGGATGEAQATLRIGVVRPDLGWTESPACTVFAGHPALATVASESFVEASRLSFVPHVGRDALIQLLGHMAAMADLYRTEWLVACPCIEHSFMYRRQFGFRALAAPQPCPGVRSGTQLLGARRSELKEYVREHKLLRRAWLDALASLGGTGGRLLPSLAPPTFEAHAAGLF